MSEVNSDYSVTPYQLHPTSKWPSNSKLPILHYQPTQHNSISKTNSPDNLANHFEGLVSQNDWRPEWRYTMYNFHHYHSNTAECLCIFKGSAHVQLGAESSNVSTEQSNDNTLNITIKKGDIVILPPGTGHHLIHSEGGFEMVGAYPNNSPHCDMKKEKKNQQEPDKSIENKNISLPTNDPIMGKEGPLIKLWKLQ